MIESLFALVLMRPPVLPPLPGERPMEEPSAPKTAPEPGPKTEPEQEQSVEDDPPPQPAPPRGPAAKQPSAKKGEPAPAKKSEPAPAKKSEPAPAKKSEPALATKSTATPPPMPSQLQPATADELAALHEDDRVAADDLDATPDRDPARASQPGDRPRDSAQTADVTLHRTAEPDTPPPLTFRRRPQAPRKTSAFLLGYRLFTISDALGRPQSWHMGSVEVSPLRGYVRLDFITELGAEGGPAAHDGDRADLMFVEKGGLGLQYPGYVTPFVQFQGGAGFSRVELFDRNDLLFLYTLGIDVGAQWAVTKWLFFHAAIGWLHPTFRRPELSTHYDAFTFKLGFGM